MGRWSAADLLISMQTFWSSLKGNEACYLKAGSSLTLATTGVTRHPQIVERQFCGHDGPSLMSFD